MTMTQTIDTTPPEYIDTRYGRVRNDAYAEFVTGQLAAGMSRSDVDAIVAELKRQASSKADKDVGAREAARAKKVDDIAQRMFRALGQFESARWEFASLTDAERSEHTPKLVASLETELRALTSRH